MQELDKEQQTKVDEWLRKRNKATGIVGEVNDQDCKCEKGKLMSTNAIGIAEVAGVASVVFVCDNCGRPTFFDAGKPKKRD
jgi:hypothetical protein